MSAVDWIYGGGYFRARLWELRKPLPGLRHNQEELLIPHRFPVVGGLNWREVMVRPTRNTLLDLIAKPTKENT